MARLCGACDTCHPINKPCPKKTKLSAEKQNEILKLEMRLQKLNSQRAEIQTEINRIKGIKEHLIR